MSQSNVSAQTVVRIVLIVTAVVAALYLVYLLRTPLTWIFLAVFLAIALSGPVNFFNRYVRRGGAIAIVYLGLLLVPVALTLVIVPPLADEGNKLAENAPRYAADARSFVEDSATLRKLEEDYKILSKIEEEAEQLPSKLGGAAGTLRDVGLGIVNSVFAMVTILVLTGFLLGSGRGWVDKAVSLQSADRAQRMERMIERISRAVSGYVGGALAIAVIAGVLSYIVMTILGVPFRAPLAVLVGVFSLIPLIGATVAAVIVGVVTLFNNFPEATIAWTIWAIIYQQVENTFIQPQIQRRAVDLHPFVVLVSVLFGSTLLGVLGALVAIPVAATVQITIRELWHYRLESRGEAEGSGPPGAGAVPSPKPPDPRPGLAAG